MRRLGHSSFTVEIHPEVWRQVSIISRDAFRRIQEALRQQATALSQAMQEAAAVEPVVEEVQLPVDGYAARCQIDVRLRSLRLVEVRPLYGAEDPDRG